MFGIRKLDEDRGKKVGEVREWVREAHGVPVDTTVLVTELKCHEPGCPPVETVVAILRGAGDTRQAKLACGIADVTRAQIEGLEFVGATPTEALPLGPPPASGGGNRK